MAWPLGYTSVEALREAYRFGSMQDFLDVYYAGANVRGADDFRALPARTSSERRDGVVPRRSSSIRSPPRGILSPVVSRDFLRRSPRVSASWNLLAAHHVFLRHLSGDATTAQKRSLQGHFCAVGLDSSGATCRPSSPASFASAMRACG